MPDDGIEKAIELSGRLEELAYHGTAAMILRAAMDNTEDPKERMKYIDVHLQMLGTLGVDPVRMLLSVNEVLDRMVAATTEEND